MRDPRRTPVAGGRGDVGSSACRRAANTVDGFDERLYLSGSRVRKKQRTASAVRTTYGQVGDEREKHPRMSLDDTKRWCEEWRTRAAGETAGGPRQNRGAMSIKKNRPEVAASFGSSAEKHYARTCRPRVEESNRWWRDESREIRK